MFLTIRSGISNNDSLPANGQAKRNLFGGHSGPELPPDYVAVLNEELRRDVDPSSNVEVQLRRILGPNGLPPRIRERYYQLLGVPLPDLSGEDFFQSFADFIRENRHNISTNVPNSDAATHQPWTERDYPAIAEWLRRNEERLNDAAEATELSDMYVPLVYDGSNNQGPQFLAMLLPATTQHRELGSALLCRAMLRLGQGNAQSAWNDLQACHRLARHVGSGGTLLEARTAVDIESRACRADRQLAIHGRLSADDARRYELDLRQLEPLPGLARYLDKSERYKFSDAARIVEHNGFAALDKYLGNTGREIEGIEQIAMAAVDWNEVLGIGQHFYDQFVAAASTNSPTERRDKLQALELETQQLTMRGMFDFSSASNNKRMAQLAAAEVLRRVLPKVTAELRAIDEAAAELCLSRLSLLLTGYRADHGQYPDSLDALAPKYINEVPTDPLNGRPFIYQRQNDASRIYSIGTNERDDRGVDRTQRLDADDLLVVLPPIL